MWGQIFDLVGVVLLLDKSMKLLYITNVHPESYGEAIGLRPGDYLIFVGLLPVAGDRQNMYKIIERSSRFHTLHYIREGKWHRALVRYADFGIETESHPVEKMGTKKGRVIIDLINNTPLPINIQYIQEYHIFTRLIEPEEVIDYSDDSEPNLSEDVPEEEDKKPEELKDENAEDKTIFGDLEYRLIQPKGMSILALVCPPLWLVSNGMYKLTLATLIMYSLSALQGIEYFVLWYLLLAGLFAKNHGTLRAGFLSSEGWKNKGIAFATNPYEVNDMIKASDDWIDREMRNRPPEELEG